jgi:hypothetical protein
LENSIPQKNIKIELPCDLAIPLLGIHPKKLKSVHQKCICTSMFSSALFILAKTWKQPKCSSTDEWIEKIWHLYTQWSTIQLLKKEKLCLIE